MSEKYKKEKPVYVVVSVSYDYYRFQENFYASTDIEQARAYAGELSEKQTYSFGEHNIPIIEDEEKSYSLDEQETRHVWIEKL